MFHGDFISNSFEITHQGSYRWESLDNVVVCITGISEYISFYIAIEIKRNETFLHCTRQQINNTMVRKFYMRETAQLSF